jgi:hypothetical protein
MRKMRLAAGAEHIMYPERAMAVRCGSHGPSPEKANHGRMKQRLYRPVPRARHARTEDLHAVLHRQCGLPIDWGRE